MQWFDISLDEKMWEAIALYAHRWRQQVFWLGSRGKEGEIIGREFLAWNPDSWFCYFPDDPLHKTAWEVLDSEWERAKKGEGILFYHLGYEAAIWAEPRLDLEHKSDTHSWPALAFGIFDFVLFRDDDGMKASKKAKDWIERFSEQLLVSTIGEESQIPGKISISDNLMEYKHKVEQVKMAIARGDVYQANISLRFDCEFVDYPPEGLHLWKAAVKVNPGPYMAYVAMDQGMELVSCSPELLFSWKGNLVETRPIAGTRKIEKDESSNAKLTDEMLNSAKELAEHDMLVDLERNDIGRMSKPGKVDITEHRVVETYSTVQHLVSHIEGEIDIELPLSERLKAMFPGGTITGVPKIRCMELINTIEEGLEREAFTGSVGWAYEDEGACNILIRTLWNPLSQDIWVAQAGGGIVWESNAEDEYKEAMYKAKGMIKVLTAGGVDVDLSLWPIWQGE